MLIAARFALFPALLVAETPIIHEPTNRWNGVRRHFHQIKPAFARHLHRITCQDDPNLRTFVIDQANLADPDPLVDPSLCRSSYSAPPQGGSGTPCRTIKMAMNATTKGRHRLC